MFLGERLAESHAYNLIRDSRRDFTRDLGETFRAEEFKATP